MELRKDLARAKRIVVKVGSSSITHESTGHVSLKKLEMFVRQLSDLKNAGKEIIVVTSGAQAVGISALRMKERPKELPMRQAIAAVGQASLMTIYQKLFREYNHQIAQILITKDIIEDKQRCENAKNTFEELIRMQVIPVVNENDTISTEEIEFGDNDRLSATVAILTQADLLIILSDIDGLYDKDPKTYEDAICLDVVHKVNDDIYNMAGVNKSRLGTGGMLTKLMAAEMTNDMGIDMVIAHAGRQHVLNDILEGKSVGTLFKC